jgi:hypothetical protein
MNERAITNFLNNNITQKRVNALAQASNAALPGSGVVVAILGALVMRAVASAKEYIDRIDQMPIVPPDILPHMTYNQAIKFFKDKNLTGMFSEVLQPAADENNPDIVRARAQAGRAATVVKKCFDSDDGLFNVFYQNQIENGEYLTVWKTYGEFLEFKASLRYMLPPAKFETMFEAILKAVAKEGVKQIKDSEAYKRVKELVKSHIDKIVPSNIADMDKVINKIGDIK